MIPGRIFYTLMYPIDPKGLSFKLIDTNENI
jgi:hypothetical protein